MNPTSRVCVIIRDQYGVPHTKPFMFEGKMRYPDANGKIILSE